MYSTKGCLQPKWKVHDDYITTLACAERIFGGFEIAMGDAVAIDLGRHLDFKLQCFDEFQEFNNPLFSTISLANCFNDGL